MTSNRRTKILLAIALLAVLALALGLWIQKRQAGPVASLEVGTKAQSVKPALTVTLTSPVPTTLTTSITANGSVAAWQEASIGSEAQGLRLEQVNVNVGDRVAKGQLLASFASDTVAAQLQQTRAAIAEARAILAEAGADAQRARGLQGTGALSAQQISQYLTAERTAQARLELQQAAEKLQQLRLEQARVLAPDSGIISARNATLGAVAPAGQELFRLIRQGRLEWRAEVAEADLARLKPGMPVSVAIAGGAPITGRARVVAPTVDPATRNGLVYVDLPSQATVRAGMFARGSFELGQSQGLTLPQSAVLLREGFNIVMRVNAEGKVSEVKVGVGRRAADRVEIIHGLDATARVVVAGAGFLADGDTVRVVTQGASPSPSPSGTASAPATGASR